MLHRRSVRLKNYDYSKAGLYFVTINTYSKQKLFGRILNKRMYLSEGGCTVNNCWKAIPNHYPNVILDEWVIMPDHIHGIIGIEAIDDEKHSHVGVQNFEPLHGNVFLERNSDINSLIPREQRNQYQHIIPRSLGCIVRGFKIGVTKCFRELSPGMVVWQRNYYEHIIKSEEELRRIRLYIRFNPQNWRPENDLLL